jgi:hypothetical protein
MGASRRIYQRKKTFFTITVSPDEFPVIASPIEAIPVSPMGFVTRQTYDGSLKNSSLDGFCFITKKNLEPGTEIEVSLRNDVKDFMSQDEWHARVMWCRPVSEENSGYYEIGAKRIRDGKLPLINWKNPDFGSIKCV